MKKKQYIAKKSTLAKMKRNGYDANQVFKTYD
jgi:hypothetical protein